MFQPILSPGLACGLLLASLAMPTRAAVPKSKSSLPPRVVGRLVTEKPDYISWIVFSDDGKFAATSQSDSICLWEVATGKRLWKVHPKDLYSSLVFSRDGKVLVTRHPLVFFS